MCRRPEDVLPRELAADCVRCVLIELRLDLLVLGPPGDLLVLVLLLVRTRAAHLVTGLGLGFLRVGVRDRGRGRLIGL